MATTSYAVGGVRLHLPELVLGVAAGGFAITFAELVVTDHTGGTQVIGVIAAGLGLALCLTGLLARSRIVLRPLAAGLLVLSISGPLGVFLHAGGEAEASEAPSRATPDVLAWEEEDEDEDEDEEEDEDDESLPPLAPLGLSGLGLLGAAGVLSRED